MSNLFKPKIPEPKKAAAMPDPEDPALKDARRRKQASMSARGGRESTILSDALAPARSTPVGATGKLGA